MTDYPLPHPARGHLAARRITIRAVAERINYSAHWTSRVLNGHERPTKTFQERLSRLLDVPASDLFHADLSEPGDPYPGNRSLAVVARSPDEQDSQLPRKSDKGDSR